MEWTRSETLALASADCATCHGLGLVIGKRTESPCNCVLREVFRTCYRRFRYCVAKEKSMTKTSLQFTPGTDRRRAWGRKDEEYMADFVLVARRELAPKEYRVFNYHFLLGAGWALCSKKLEIDRGNFYHMIYRIEQKLGRVFRELEPYGLFPLEEYFSSTVETARPFVAPQTAAPDRLPVHPPLRRAA